jgi:hypothetical protein
VSCSELSLAHGVRLAGTTSQADRWLLLEHRSPWGRDATEESGLPPALVERLRHCGRRILLLRRPGRPQGPPVAFSARTTELGGELRLLVRWRHGAFATTHLGDREHVHRVRSPAGAFGIGLLHGMGGSAGVGVLLLAAIPSRELALVALVVLAIFTAVSMTIVTTGFGAALSAQRVSGAVATAAPALALSSLAFGLWYAAAAWSLAPYPF